MSNRDAEDMIQLVNLEKRMDELVDTLDAILAGDVSRLNITRGRGMSDEEIKQRAGVVLFDRMESLKDDLRAFSIYLKERDVSLDGFDRLKQRFIDLTTKMLVTIFGTDEEIRDKVIENYEAPDAD